MTSIARLYINGRFLTQSLSGMQRYSEEMVSGLDALLRENPALARQMRPEVLVPPGPRRDTHWTTIAVRETGRMRGHAWEQIELAYAARDGILLNLQSAGPLAHRRSVLVMHDAAIFAHPEHFSRAYRMLHRFLRPRLARRALRLATISAFSRRELARWCGVPEAAFTILGDSGEHILGIAADATILRRRGLEPGRYALTVGNQTPNKNIALAISAFQQARPDGWKLAVAGGGSEHVFGRSDTGDHDAVVRLGRVTDGELRALYENAGLFLFPSRYEGFGVPPLEAMALGCPVISSDSSAMPEVLGDAALFFRNDDMADLAGAILRLTADRELARRLIAAGAARAAEYRWSDSARTLLTLLRDAAAPRATAPTETGPPVDGILP